ncbi:response regulator [Mariniflexile maritimum]|jgi:DNA-binding NarL/FixJ family response regulator|uniref:response regulator n=1 Tax=Mariniflexile maritimum TaxID=2682493 RepID=UPI0012F64C77|nr:response regulator transcription factor [Mariniflexile maritimum]MCB0451029.1 response regulator transcription factor [Confluentibacter sp.]HMQ43491.1 response regulator transcription factor [Mariniflexile sp.]HMR16467.1 response regulator transcription factor [Mariniflexile sp.]
MIKLLIADNHPITRKGLEVLLSAASNIKIVASVDNGEAILEYVKKHPVDIILTEADLPVLNGLTVLRHLKHDYPDIKTIILSAQPEEVYAINALKAGAFGYIHKSVNVLTISEAILKVYNGGIHLSNDLTQQLAFGNRINKGGTFYKKLSTREAEVLKLLTIGRKNKEISKELDINEKTVSTYKARLMRKLKVTNLIDLVNQAKLNTGL